MREKRFSVPVMGGSSLLTILSVLCLVIFALLSVSTVQSQRSLSEASAAAVEGYYAADCRAEEILARLRTGEVPRDVSKEGTTYRYSCPISDTQSLEVEVELEGGDYTILRWQAVSTTDWEEDDSLNVWTGAEGGSFDE